MTWESLAHDSHVVSEAMGMGAITQAAGKIEEKNLVQH